jgi:hypothetical protein
MTFHHQKDGVWLLAFARAEWLLLRELLQLFPVTPPDHFAASRESPSAVPASSSQLLQDSAMTQQAQLKRLVQRWMDTPANQAPDTSTSPDGTAVVLRMSPADIEQLLRILNDIRVGSWVALGCPEDASEAPPQASADVLRHHFALEFSGFLQGALLGAMNAAG